MTVTKYTVTARTALRGQTNGGIAYLLPGIALKIIYLIPLLFLWRVIAGGGTETEMTLPQLLSYTYANALLASQLIVKTYLTDWDYDSKSVLLFTRPMSVYGQVISRTAGEWAPDLLFFSLPMAALSPLLGISLVPASAWFFVSLLLCISLGFTMEFLFFCVTLRLRNVSWLTLVIRSALSSFFSGTVIPFRILPFGLDRWMRYQPFGSLGGAPLSLLTGAAEASEIIPVQIFWNILLWGAAVFWFNKSRERMVSFGG